MTADPTVPVVSRTLDNGLRVVVSPTPGLGVVAVNLWYDVGSRHEEPHRQGFAHLFEHLMFQGSRHVKPGDHFALLQGHGASLNATTSFDRTNYYESLPAGALDLALWLEADRMAYLDDALTQENFDNQVDVVAQERSQRMDNVPYGTVFEKALPLIFDAEHPYGHLPIGNMRHLAEATLDEVSAFHSTYYMPSNAVLTIVGDVTEFEALRKAEQYFGHIAPGTPPDRSLPQPLPPVAEPVRLDVSEDVPMPAIWFALRLPADSPTGRELAAVGLASSIVGEGDTSRLHRRLVRHDQTAMSAGLGINELIAGNALGIGSVHAVPGQGLDEIAQVFDEVVSQFAVVGPTQLELDVARAQAERDWLDAMSTAAGRADALSGCALLFGDPALLNERLPVLQAITADEVQSAAQRWLTSAVHAQVRVVPSATGQTEDARAVERADAAAGPDSSGAAI
ncbi:MAG: insulinase family protein [Nocardioidaceae bacterium]|nr:insulinase family protein [Nocardioidaceae bacterium]